MNTINIVGAGIAGSIVATLLRSNGYDVRVIDDGDSKSASAASSNLYIASWLKKFSSAEASNGINVIEHLYGPVTDQPFSSGVASAMKVKHIAQRHILVKPDVIGTALQVRSDGVDVAVGPMKETQTFSGTTIVCAGYRLQQMLTGTICPNVWIKVGHAFFFEGQLRPGQSRLAIVSPYRHEKLYQFDENTIYYADSVALEQTKYDKRAQEVKQVTLDRARKHVGDLPVREFKVGYRPFMDGFDFGYVDMVRPNVWVVNGGGKNGLVAYANAASKISASLGGTPFLRPNGEMVQL